MTDDTAPSASDAPKVDLPNETSPWFKSLPPICQQAFVELREARAEIERAKTNYAIVHNQLRKAESERDSLFAEAHNAKALLEKEQARVQRVRDRLTGADFPSHAASYEKESLRGDIQSILDEKPYALSPEGIRDQIRAQRDMDI